MTSFSDLNIAEPIIRAITEKGYTETTPIQAKGIPVAMSGRDMFGIAQTGTGKTAAFAIPIIQKLWQNLQNVQENSQKNNQRNASHKEKRKIRALVLTPTRELAEQINDCFTDYGKYTGLRHCVIYGGVGQKPQTDKLARGIDILIATPGRLIDLIRQGFISLKNVKYFVLDEADRMLDMGFVADIRRIYPMLNERHQTLLFSATMPKSIVTLTKELLRDPARVEVTPESSVVETVHQCVYYVEKGDKRKTLVDVLKQHKERSVLVFSRTKHGADKISKTLKQAGIKSEAIHGNKSQNQRQNALNSFKDKRINVMVATDIAARGIDIDKLNLVINYDLPDVAETYVHRIGRTGRAGNEGLALTFCSKEELIMMKSIQKLTGVKLETIKVS